MKFPKTLLATFGLAASSLVSQAASVIIANYQNGPGDRLWANVDGVLMASGVVAVGYFDPDVNANQIDTIAELYSKLGSFTILASATPGSSVYINAPGYLSEDGVSFSPDDLLGRTLYAIATNASSLSAATHSSAYSMFAFGTILEDAPTEQAYLVNPSDYSPIIGALGTFTGEPGNEAVGADYNGNYATLKLVPEPSSALLGAVGALALLRRRRK